VLKTCFFLFGVINSTLLFAQPVNIDALKIQGHSLANYQTCADVAKDNQDKIMQSYYLDMFSDLSLKVTHYSAQQAALVNETFHLSLAEFAKLNRQSLAVFCGSRLDDLTRKMQKKKLDKQ